MTSAATQVLWAYRASFETGWTAPLLCSQTHVLTIHATGCAQACAIKIVGNGSNNSDRKSNKSDSHNRGSATSVVAAQVPTAETAAKAQAPMPGA